MAAPSYTEDLTDITLAETTTGWARVGVAGNPGVGADFAMQGTLCVDKQVSNGDGGLQFNNGSAITLNAGDHIWTWLFAATPGITATIQNKGAFILIGSGAAAYCQYHVAGNDTLGAAGRVARCYPVDYSTRTGNTSAPFRTLVGSPVANPQYFGGGLVTTATARTNLGVDAIRYGTGGYLNAGELVSAGDGSDNPCTFEGFRAQSDAIANRWGILTGVGGGFEAQGKFAIGQDNSKVATLCRFRDSDRNITFADTPHAAADFSEIIIDHASTVCEWTNISLTALGTTNRGRVTVNAANPVFTVTGGTWTGLAATTLRSNSTISGLTWRGCDTNTANGAEITGCLIDKSFASVAMVHSDLSLLTGNRFVSDGTGHAVNIGTIASSATVTWDNELSGYVAGTTGDPVTTGTSGNEAILCNVASGQKLTINVAAGASVPSIKNDGAGTVAVEAGLVTVTFTFSESPIGGEFRIYDDDGDGNEITLGTDREGTESLASATYSLTHSSGEAGGIIRAQYMNPGVHEEETVTVTLASNDQTINIILTPEENT